jgi:hydrogenase expression/formation protein HypE
MAELSGKMGHRQFEAWMKDRCGALRKEVTQGPAFGVDISVVDIGQGLALLSTSDPLSLIPSLGLQESAWLSVHLMANDMATSGHAPQYGQFVLNLPTTLGEADFQSYWEHVHRYCEEIGLAITGGHTGFIPGQNSTIAGGGTFSSVVPKDQVLLASGAQEGDSILLSKSAALSSAAILALSFPKKVVKHCGKETFLKAAEGFYRTSSLQEGLVATKINARVGKKVVTALHDVTEGGVYGAIYEMMVASGKGALIDDKALPIEATQQEVCRLFDLDPRYCIGAGSMVITCTAENEGLVINALQEDDIACTHVGQVQSASAGLMLQQGEGKITPMTYYEKDPYWAAFFKAFQSGWK